MHIPNAILDPKVAASTAAIGVGGLLYCLRRIEKRHGERTTVLMGTMAAFVFAAQMVNFPLGPLAVSGHLLGGVLAAVMLGPWAGAVVIASVLIVQCLLFGDGGLMALGANFVNMGLIGSIGGYAIYAPIRRAIGGNAGVIFGAMVAAWFSVLLASGAFAFELAASGRRDDFLQVLCWMALVHAAIGVGEAIITGLVLKFILSTRPDLVDETEPTEARVKGWFQIIVAGLAVALSVAIFLAPFASEHPDGLEKVGGWFGFVPEDSAPSLPVAIPDYQLPVLKDVSLKAATAAAGAAGTVVVFAVAMLMALVVARAGRPEPRSSSSVSTPAPEGVAGNAA